MSAKITFVTFGKVKRGATGTQNESYALAKRLYDTGRLQHLVCMETTQTELPVPKEMILPNPRLEGWHQQFRRLLFKIDSHHSLPNKRRLFEQTFDWLVCRSGCHEGASVLLFNRPGFPKTVEMARRAGIKTIAIASVLHPKFNANLVRLEQKKFGLPDRSVYTDLKRVKNLSRFYSEVDHLIVQSQLSRDVFLSHGIQPERIHLLDGRFPIDTERFTPDVEAVPNDPFRIVHLSHMNLIKGIGTLLEAWKKLDLPNAELVLAGTIDPDVQTIVDRMEAQHVTLAGPVEDPAALLRQADVFVSPSISDSFPYTILEAMASGTVVISSNHCGLSSLLHHGQDGFVYRYDDTSALVEHLTWCHDNRGRLSEMGIVLRAKAVACRSSDSADRILELVDRILD
ncbi:MAG: glycosyltransferase family 4 protein [Gemmatimonadales bacterium]|nr:glycosyltransferase family 4 protein [Gemmatimonadales bacterium]